MQLLGDLRYSLRLLRRTPTFSCAAVAIVALGIGTNTAAFSLVNALLLQPRPGRIDHLVAVFDRDRTKPDSYRDFSYATYVDLRERGDVFESLMAHTFTPVGVRDGDITRRSFVSLVSANYFATLGVHLAAGRPFTEAEEWPGAGTPVAVASYSAWRRAGFDPGFVGRSVRIGAVDVTIVGVAPKGFGGTMSVVALEWWFPLGLYDEVVSEMFKPSAGGLAERGNHILNLAGAVKPGVSVAAAERSLEGFADRLGHDHPATDRDRQFTLGRLPRLGVSSEPDQERGLSLASGLLTAMAGLVLIVACLNLANLLLARGTAGRREIAIRQALGSGRTRIVRQLLVEGLVVSAAGAAISLPFAWWTTASLSAWVGKILPLGIEVIVAPSSRLVLAAAAFALVATLCFALFPAWQLSRPITPTDLKGLTVSPIRGMTGGPPLIVGQLAVSLAVVTTGGLFVRAAIKAASAGPGFALDHQLVFSIDPSMIGYDEAQTTATYRRVLDRIGTLPGVARVSLASLVSFGEFSEGREVRLPGTADTYRPQYLIVQSDYFDTIRLPLVRGRGFTRFDDEPNERQPVPAVIDVALSRRMFGDADPLGRHMRISLREGQPPVDFEVIGLVQTTRHDLFEIEPRGHVYVPLGSHFRANMILHVRVAPPADETAMLSTVRRELQRMDPSLPVITARTMTMHRDMSFSEWAVHTAATLFSAMGGLALIISAIGVYGLKAYDIARRTREIGIRIALGATSAQVVDLIVREGARTVLVGLAIGLALALAAGKLVSGLLYQVSPFDPAVLITSAAILSAAAMLACYLPARRAAGIAPIEALRLE